MEESITWIVDAYEQRDKHPDWFWAVGIISVAVAVAAIIYNNFLFGVLVLLGGASIIYFGVKKPHELEITIDDAGVTINDVFHPYQEIKSFYVNVEEDQLYLVFDRTFLSKVTIALGEMSPDPVRMELIKHVDEREEKESVLDKFLDRFGF